MTFTVSPGAVTAARALHLSHPQHSAIVGARRTDDGGARLYSRRSGLGSISQATFRSLIRLGLARPDATLTELGLAVKSLG